ncbi:MAG: hypothetical protein DRO13_04870 [Thermoprotei archaeon]|nr:MAG: hypothetical protein DRO13_04870 [Thermoprotei archaeon]
MIIYVYPKWHTVSFTVIAQKHIQYLRNHYKINELDEKEVDKLNNMKHTDTIILHPLFEITKLRYNVLTSVRSKCDTLVCFEVADTDRISNKAVDFANKCDLIIVPSTFAKYAFVSSGVKSAVEVVPHGISPVFTGSKVEPTDEELKELKDIKEDKHLIYVLYFLWHSGFRKGADIVYRVMREIQKKYDNVYLVVKRGRIEDPYMALLRRLKLYEVSRWLPERELVALYDMCDICLVPSRGGGFEVNAIEALARGLITFVPRWGAFIDYINFPIPIEIETFEKVFKDNPIHVGLGCRPSSRDLYKKMIVVLNHLESFKDIFECKKKAIQVEYSWERVCEKLRAVFEEYDIR